MVVPSVSAERTLTSLYEAIHRRRDVRGQFTGAPIDPDALERMLSAAHAAPSVGLTQPWDFVLVSDVATKEAFVEHVNTEPAVFAATTAPGQPCWRRRRPLAEALHHERWADKTHPTA